MVIFAASTVTVLYIGTWGHDDMRERAPALVSTPASPVENPAHCLWSPDRPTVHSWAFVVKSAVVSSTIIYISAFRPVNMFITTV